MVMFYLYYDIVHTTTKWGHNGSAVQRVELPEALVHWLIKHVTVVLEQEKPLVEVHVPVKIFGDLHGQFADFLELLLKNGDRMYSGQGDYIIDTEAHYLFLGDYVNRGKMSTEVICLLFALKIRFP